MHSAPGRMTFLLSLLATGAFLVVAVKSWSVPISFLGQLLMLCIALFCIVIACAWLLIKLLGFLRMRARIKQIANDQPN